MIAVVITGPTLDQAKWQLKEAEKIADLAELRFDLFHPFTLHEIQQLIAKVSIPLIFTLRSQAHGGQFSGGETERLSLIEKLATLSPAYIDLENGIDLPFVKKIKTTYPKIKIILSHHNFLETPLDLSPLYSNMQGYDPDLYKLAFMANTATEALRLLLWAREQKGPIIPISMGTVGQFTRILAPIFDVPFTYAALSGNETTAPGQLTAHELLSLYRYKALSPKTHLFGLIGDPVDSSIGHQIHNPIFEKTEKDAVYVKIPVKSEELAEFISLARQLPFSGLSVTIPHKTAIIAHIDTLTPEAKAIGAVNTLKFSNGGIEGSNTDAKGALDAIERHILVHEKKIAILGAGGAAQAIAYEAVKRGGKITIANRTKSKADALVKQFSGDTSLGLDELSKDYDILINCTSLPDPIPASLLRKETVFMDINIKPKSNSLHEAAIKLGCPVVYGYEMFILQAIGQYNKWFIPNVFQKLDFGLCESSRG